MWSMRSPEPNLAIWHCAAFSVVGRVDAMLCPLLSPGTPEMSWATEPSECHYDGPLNLCRFIFYPLGHRCLPRASKILATSCLSVLINTTSSTSSTHVMICGTHGSPRSLQTVLRRRAAGFAHTSAGLWICVTSFLCYWNANTPGFAL